MTILERPAVLIGGPGVGLRGYPAGKGGAEKDPEGFAPAGVRGSGGNVRPEGRRFYAESEFRGFSPYGAFDPGRRRSDG